MYNPLLNNDFYFVPGQLCAEINVKNNLTAVCSNANRFRSECVFSCPEKTFLVGPQSVVCIENANRDLMWSDIVPACETGSLKL